MALINCYECGASISESADQCPKCYTTYIHGAKCLICGERMKARDAGLVGLPYFHGMHSRCGDRVFNQRGRCRECGRTIWGGWLSTWSSDLEAFIFSISGGSSASSPPYGPAGKCPECGVLDSLSHLGSCAICRQPVFGQLDHAATGDGPRRHRYCHGLRG